MKKPIPVYPLFLLILLIIIFPGSHAQQYTEEDMKAAFIYNFGNYIEWTNEGSTEKFTIGVLGNIPIFNALENACRNQKLKNKSIQVIFFKDMDRITATHMLFVSKINNYSIERVIEKIRGKNTLLVSENYEFHSSMINFIIIDNKQRFEINEELIQEQGLEVSPKLLKLAVKSKSDWQSLYVKTSNLLEKEKEKVKIQQNELIAQQEIIKSKEQILSDQEWEIEIQKNKLTGQLEEILKQTEILRFQKREIRKQTDEIGKQKKALNKYLEKIHMQRLILFLFVALSVVISGLGFFIYRGYKMKKEKNKQLEDKNREIQKRNEEILNQKKEVEKLLLNILPAKVASELKEKGISKPEVFDHVTVFFSDLVGFTKQSALLGPEPLINELNDIFTGFDNVIEKNRCERIKTMGDAYLAVCGMPDKNPRHAENMIRAAIEMLEFLNQRNKVKEVFWEIRIGIHTGKVVGGVVGIKKYIYDVFGDTINTASRMESYSEPMKINISETTYLLAKDNFRFIERPSIQVKGKGEMKMYFIDNGNSI